MRRLTCGERDILAEQDADARPTTAALVADLTAAVEAVEAERDRLRASLTAIGRQCEHGLSGLEPVQVLAVLSAIWNTAARAVLPTDE